MDDNCLNEYNLEDLISNTTFESELFIATKRETKEKFLIKRYKKSILTMKRLKIYLNNEIYFLNNICHENIIKYYNHKIGNNYIYIILEFCNGGTLRNCLDLYKTEYNRPFSQNIIQHISKQIISALSYLHKNRILHRNIKLDNILVHFPTEEDKKRLNMLSCKIKVRDFFLQNI